jgi:hypothetical protein
MQLNIENTSINNEMILIFFIELKIQKNLTHIKLGFL